MIAVTPAGQKVACRVSTYAYPHRMRLPLIVDSVRLMRTQHIAPYHRVKAHVKGFPDLWIEASEDRFWAS